MSDSRYEPLLDKPTISTVKTKTPGLPSHANTQPASGCFASLLRSLNFFGKKPSFRPLDADDEIIATNHQPTATTSPKK